MRLASSSRLAAFAIASFAVLAPASALANGRYPAAGQIALDPKNPQNLLVRATYGLMLSQNGGQSWSWICEQAVGYGGQEDPMMAFTADGSLLAGTFEGLSLGQPGGCQWTAFAALTNKYVIDLAVDKVDPTHGVLVISNSTGQDDAGQALFLTQLWQTSDSGKTWTQTGVDLPDQFLGLTVDTAPSDAQRVYLSGRYGPPDYPGVIERSDDRGATWQKLPVTGADSMHLPYIGGVDPKNPDVLYVRLDADPSDTLLVSKDGGMTWATVFTAQGKLLGFAISPDGATVAIGSPGIVVDGGITEGAGVWTAPASTLAFTQVSSAGAECLTWAPGGLYACADEFKDKFTAGVSTDQGKTFTPIMHLGGVCPLVCSVDSPVTQQCPMAWPYVASTISSTCDNGTGGQPAADAGPGGGTSSGCSSHGYALSEGGARGGAVLASAALAAAWLRARRRRRFNTPPRASA
jgi:photosystem II stability/assembly factor-like uncharacterized protein